MFEDIDYEEFWRENRVCYKPFSTDKPRAPLHIGVGEDLIKSLAGVSDHRRFYLDYKYQMECHQRAGEILHEELGMSLQPRICQGSVVNASIFGGEVVFPDNAPPWIRPVVTSIADLPDFITHMKSISILDAGEIPRWLEWRNRLAADFGIEARLGSGVHGIAQLATLIMGPERFIYLLYDHPDLAECFLDALMEVLWRFIDVMRKETGVTGRGIHIASDDSALLSPDLFGRFIFPRENECFRRYAPENGDTRYYHSDGDMRHLLRFLREYRLTSVNLGPAVNIEEIRKKLPNTVIYGHVPPLLLRNGTPEQIIERVKADFQKVGVDGGLVIDTAGSINEGTPLVNLKALVYAVHRYCRYGK